MSDGVEKAINIFLVIWVTLALAIDLFAIYLDFRPFPQWLIDIVEWIRDAADWVAEKLGLQ